MTGDSESIRTFQSQCPAILDKLPDTDQVKITPEFQTLERRQGLCTSAEVVFNVQGCSIFNDPAQYNGHFEVLKTWISRDYLWNSVRQMGGAYGCFVQFNHITGNIGFVSYRDPHVSRTYNAYNDLPSHIANLDLSDQVMEQLIIGTYGGLIPHQSPAAIGAAARNDYLAGITKKFKLQRIREVLETSQDSIKSFAHLFQNLTNDSYRATIGNGDKIRAEENSFDTIMDI